jgi:two-component system response regulator AtoC
VSRVLVVEDEPVIRMELKRVLKKAGHEVATAGDVAAAEAEGLGSFDLILSDLRLPGASGDTLLEKAIDTPVILMTAFGTIESAVDAMKRGATDYLLKPFENRELLRVVDRVFREDRLTRKAAALEAEVRQIRSVAGMVGSSASMQRVFERIGKVAPTDATVLILGESGTGKELVARAIHEGSGRADETFVPVNCASIPEALLESELFGHERGAFTGAVAAAQGLVAAAHRGTLFLDEVGELPPSAQARLLRVLQESEVRRVGASKAKRVDVRVVAATHRDLAAMVKEGAFREDLYFRLKVVEVELPPLRDRGDDVLELAEALLEESAARLGAPGLELSEEAERALVRHHWPGNVRELANAIERAVILHDAGPLTPELLGLADTEAPDTPRDSVIPVLEGDDVSLEAYFRSFVLQNQDQLSETDLAKKLGISRKALWERRQRLDIPRSSRR